MLAVACQPPPAAVAGDHRSAPAFRDCADCPELIAIPGGSFIMGAPDSEPGHYGFEGPQHPVRVAGFALGATEVTRAQYAAFAADTGRPEDAGCFSMGEGGDATGAVDPQATWRHPGFEQTDAHPVVCVSWDDATAYAAWLARKTGRAYRLPSEAEWEYAARAGTTTTYYWGDSADHGCACMNGGDVSTVRALPRLRETLAGEVRRGESGARLVDCDDGAGFTAPVGQYRPNAFGLRDMIGNVWEAIADCWREALPGDDRAYALPGCTDHRARGGSWNDYPRDLRAARRTRIASGYRNNSLGFRVARSEGAAAPPGG
jgi:formylglycine-generating enzyme required for sulfatase activity